MERIWRHVFFSKLRINPAEHPILMTEGPLNPRSCREKAARFFYEQLQVPALQFAIPSILSLYNSGRTTGVSVELGDELSCVLPVYEGFAMSCAYMALPLGGRDIVSLFARLVAERGGRGLSAEDSAYLVKKASYAAAARPSGCVQAHELPGDVGTSCPSRCAQGPAIVADHGDDADGGAWEETLPDGTAVVLGGERHECVEILFRPDLLDGQHEEGLHEMIMSSVGRCDCDIRAELCGGIVLGGGVSMTRGLEERLYGELRHCLHVRLVAPPDRSLSAWRGAAILASLTSWEREWISHSEYDSGGAVGLHARCVQVGSLYDRVRQ